MTPGAGVLVFGRGHIVNIMHISSLLVYSLGYSGDCSGLLASCFSIPGHLGQIIFVHGNNKKHIRDTYIYVMHLERVLSQNAISSEKYHCLFFLFVLWRKISPLPFPLYRLFDCNTPFDWIKELKSCVAYVIITYQSAIRYM